TTTAAPAVLSGVQVVGYVDKCLYAAANTAGQQLAIRTCDSKVASQRWQIYTDGTIRQDKLCMDLANGSSANGTRIQLAACNGNAAQQFLINSSYDMVNTVYGKCADVIDGNTANGAKVQLWDCNGAGHQKWMIRG
ncbi:MAG TPA: RICIN domain-containing protein, partial [Actinoplanes sp.]|nr:RICIN domain-containing protein [Actinoplanes sp.]